MTLAPQPPRKSRMFPFITHTHNLIPEAICPYECGYCWSRAKGFMGRQVRPEVKSRRWAKRFGHGDFVFLNDLYDAFAYNISDLTVNAIYGFMRESPGAKFLLMTKNPDRYHALCPPQNAVLGCTIESDANEDTYCKHSKAPSPRSRLASMEGLAIAGFHDLFISIEPIMEFNCIDFPQSIIDIEPWAVAVGYDNYCHKLPEPSLGRTTALIQILYNNGIKVYEKTLRKAWWEGTP